MEERRGYRRSALVYYLKVHDADSGELLGHLADITPQGLRVVGHDLALVPHRRYRLRIEMPEQYRDAGDPVLEADCLWSGPDVNPDLHAAGLRFADLDPVRQQTVEDLIHLLGLAI